jgi:hypothetical protein
MSFTLYRMPQLKFVEQFSLMIIHYKSFYDDVLYKLLTQQQAIDITKFMLTY